MIGYFKHAYVVLDALDECTEREDLLAFIEELVRTELNQLHILTTSRREGDIEASLGPLTQDQNKICIQSALVDADIQVHIRERFQNDPKLSRWPPKVHAEIEESLIKDANGM